MVAVVMANQHPPAAPQVPLVLLSCDRVVGLAPNSSPLAFRDVAPLKNVHRPRTCQVRLLTKYLVAQIRSCFIISVAKTSSPVCPKESPSWR